MIFHIIVLSRSCYEICKIFILHTFIFKSDTKILSHINAIDINFV